MSKSMFFRKKKANQSLIFLFISFSQELKSSQNFSRGTTFENSKFQKQQQQNPNENGNGDNNNKTNHAGVYRPPHIQNRMNNAGGNASSSSYRGSHANNYGNTHQNHHQHGSSSNHYGQSSQNSFYRSNNDNRSFGHQQQQNYSNRPASTTNNNASGTGRWDAIIAERNQVANFQRPSSGYSNNNYNHRNGREGNGSSGGHRRDHEAAYRPFHSHVGGQSGDTTGADWNTPLPPNANLERFSFLFLCCGFFLFFKTFFDVF